MTGAAIVLAATVACWVLTVAVVSAGAHDVDLWAGLVVAAYLVLVTVLTFATLMHLLARLGAAIRFRAHRSVPIDLARARVRETHPSLTVLVPSYKEESVVIFRTLLSAALLEYPRLNVVLLIDDAPAPAPGSDDAALLQGGRRLPGIVERLLATARSAVDSSWEAFRSGRDEAFPECLEAVAAQLRTWAGFWTDDHGNRLFAEVGPARLAADLDAVRARGIPTRAVAESYFHTLHDILSARVTSFERKRFANLSHEPNKAMNLNAYLSLIGGRYDVVGDELRPAVDGAIVVEEADYVLTLDADSVLRPDYAIRLVDLMEQPGNQRVAVAQTPYSAFPGARRALERIAGATTDIQYLLHQGMTQFGATFWVGANAVLRKRALDAIATTTVEQGVPVTRYIRDRTVIEDTESSVDLLIHGWTLLNYPERLAFSATPPDFGSLVIQRRRWATGGLVILPRLGELLRYRRRLRERTSVPGLCLQFHYLTSMPSVAFAFLMLLLLPTASLDGIVPLWVVPLVALPYMAVLAADLRRNGYRATDLLGIFAVNMLLLGVNLAGGVHSLRQLFAGHKSAFVRTPKISDRVAVPAVYVVFPLVLALQGLIAGSIGIATTQTLLAAYTAVTALLIVYGLLRFVGLAEAVTDVRAGFGSARRARRPRDPAPPPAARVALAWEGAAPRQSDQVPST